MPPGPSCCPSFSVGPVSPRQKTKPQPKIKEKHEKKKNARRRLPALQGPRRAVLRGPLRLEGLGLLRRAAARGPRKETTRGGLNVWLAPSHAPKEDWNKVNHTLCMIGVRVIMSVF